MFNTHARRLRLLLTLTLICSLLSSCIFGPGPEQPTAVPPPPTAVPPPPTAVPPPVACNPTDPHLLVTAPGTLQLSAGCLVPDTVEVQVDQSFTLINTDTRDRHLKLAPVDTGSGKEEQLTIGAGQHLQRAFTAVGNITVSDTDAPDLKATILVTPKPLDKQGMVIGKVLDYNTKAAISGATVQALNTNFKATTNAQGDYALQLPLGEYTLTLFANGYTFANRQASVQSYTPTTIDSIELVPLDTKVTAISSTGGTSVNADGTTNVVFASNAVSTTKAVRLTVLPVDPAEGDYSALPGPFTDGRIPLGFVKFEPDGTTFNESAVWTIDYDGPLSVGTPVPCYYWLEKEARWADPVPGQVVDLGNGKKGLRATLPHFSSYGFSAPPPPEPKPPTPPPSPDPKGPDGPDDNPQGPKNNRCKGSQINLLSGELCQTIGTLGLPSAGGLPTQITSRYRSLDVNNTVIISTSFRLAANSIFPAKKAWEFRVAGVRFRSPNSFSDDVQVKWDGRDANGQFVAPGMIEGTLIAYWTFITQLCGTQVCMATEVTYPVPVSWPVHVTRPDLSPTGLGWFSPHDTLLVDRGKYVTIIQGDGRQVVFEKKDNTYLPPKADFSTLTHNADGTWARTYRDGSSLNFNADGRLMRITDRYGNFQAILYESNGRNYPAGTWGLTTRIRRIVDTSGNTFDYAYDPNGWLASITDSADRVYRYEHDAGGHLTAFVDPLGQRETFTYDARGMMTGHTDRRTLTTNYTLDDQGRVASRRWPTGTTLSMIYDSARIAMQTDRGAPIITTLDRNYSPVAYYNGVYSSTITYNDDLLPDTSSHAPQTTLYDAHGNVIDVIAAITAHLERKGPFDQVSRATISDGNDTQYSYDAAGNPTSFTDVLGQSYSLTYDSHGQLLTIRDPLRNLTTLQYDQRGLVSSITDPLSRTVQLSYDAAGNLQRVVDPLNHSTQQSYDALNRLTAIVDALNGRTAMEYDANGNLTKLTDASGRPISYGYDKLNRLTSITQADQGVQHLNYDPDGHLIGLIDARGQSLTWEYDTADRATRKIVQGGPTVSYDYDSQDQLTGVNDGTLDTRIAYVPDTVGYPLREQQTSASLPLSVTTDYNYGGESAPTGNAVTAQARSGSGMTDTGNAGIVPGSGAMTPDLPNHQFINGQYPQEVQQPGTTNSGEVQALSPAFDTVGLASDTDGHTAVSTQQTANIRKGQLYTTVYTIRFSQSASALPALTDVSGNITSDTIWTKANSPYRVTGSVTVADGVKLTLEPGVQVLLNPGVSLNVNGTLDAVGSAAAPITFQPSQSGANTAWGSVQLGGGSKSDDSNSTHLSYVTFESGGYGNGTALSVYYSSPTLDHLTIRHSRGDGILASNCPGLRITGSNFIGNDGYAVRNNSPTIPITATLNSWGAATGPYHSTLNPGGKGQRVSDGVVFRPWNPAFQLPGDGRLSDVTIMSNANRTQTERYTYDAIGQLKMLSSTGYSTYTLSYVYDANGRLTERTPMSDMPLRSSYSYDAASQLTQLKLTNSTGTVLSEDYSYDAAGNLTQVISSRDGTISYSYDALNRLTSASAPGFNANYSYDLAGNRTGAGSVTYTYDMGGRLVSASDGTSYHYDAAGNLTGKTKGGQTTRYTWDGQGHLNRIDYPDGSFSAYQYDDFGRRIGKRLPDGTTIYYVYNGLRLMQELDSSGKLLASYTYDGLDQPISMWRGGQIYYYLLDRLGTARGLTDASGTIVTSYRYDPWGNLIDSSGTIANPFRFTGREYDAESGLYFYRARYYDPQLGRFISRDPVGLASRTANLYSYSRNNPVIYIDPSGLADVFVFGSIGAHAPLPAVVSPEVEAVAIGGYSSEDGFYGADIFARGIRIGGEADYGVVYGGKEYLTNGHSENIILAEGGFGAEGLFAGAGLCAGSYETGPDESGKYEKGVYFGISGGAIGEHGAVGFGFSLPSSPSFNVSEWFQGLTNAITNVYGVP